MQTKKMATSSSGSSGASSAGSEFMAIPMEHDDLTFDGRQEMRIKELEKKVDDEMRKKKKDWEKEVQRMREEFHHLYPTDRVWGSEEAMSMDEIPPAKRRGSAEALDARKMRTLLLEYPEARKFKQRFNLIGYEPKHVRVATDGEHVIVRAVKHEVDDKGGSVEREYIRKIDKPKEVDIKKVKSFLTCDGILVIEAPLPPHSLNLRKQSHSPSHSSQGSHASSRSRSPSSSPRSPSAQKPGVAVFIDAENGMRRMSLIVEVGPYFKPKDVTVQIIKDNRIQVKAKHEERTSERINKNKFSKEYELSEKIEAYTLRGGLYHDGKVLVGAVAKGQLNGMSVEQAGDWITDEMGMNNKKIRHCNVLDLASFPPTNVMTSSMTSSVSS